MMQRLKAELISLLDKSGMLKLLSGFPRQIRDARNIGEEINFTGRINMNFNRIIFSGLGGSAIGADIIRSYIWRECKVPIIVNRDYTLPAFADEKTLLIISSYSGNTEETLSAYEEGRKKKAEMIAVTAGGELKERAERDRIPCINLPRGLPPRCALGYSSIPVMMLFSKMGLVSGKERDIDEAADVLEGLRDGYLSPEIDQKRNMSKKIAGMLFGRYPVIYGANQHTDSVATRWREQLAENSKTISSTHLFPEMNHNEIAGWVNPKNLMRYIMVILLRDSDDHPRVAKRMDITMSIIKRRCAEAIEVVSMGEGLLSRIFSLIYIGDFASFYLALLNGEDPTPVDTITYLKQELAKL